MDAALPAGGARGLADTGSPPAFRPRGTDDLAPSGAAAKAKANLAALAVLRDLQSERRHATGDEQAVLARWSGWGSLPGVFDPDNAQWAEIRAELRATLDEREWRAARRTTLNAHYTPLPFAQAVWATARRMGFAGGRVLEPGCGTGVFLGAAPEDLDVELVGVELDPVTAGIAQALYPRAAIRREGFQDTRYPEGWFDAVLGNVPFAKVALTDPVHNRGGHSIHNHFLIKSLHLTRPGGVVACFTSRFTLDAQSPAARRELASLADLVGAVRLPEGAFRAVAGTDVVIDLVVLRRREPELPPGGLDFERSVEVATPDGAVTVNQVFAERPEWVLGDLSCAGGQYNEHDLTVRARPGRSVVDQLTAALDDVVVGALQGLVLTERRAASPQLPASSTARLTSVKTVLLVLLLKLSRAQQERRRAVAQGRKPSGHWHQVLACGRRTTRGVPAVAGPRGERAAGADRPARHRLRVARGAVPHLGRRRLRGYAGAAQPAVRQLRPPLRATQPV